MPAIRISNMFFTFGLLIAMVILSAIATWTVPAGSYDRGYVNLDNPDSVLDQQQYRDQGEPEGFREVVLAGTYRQIEQNPQGPVAVLLAPFRGLLGVWFIVVFIFIVGGSFAIFHGTGSLGALVGWLVNRYSDRGSLLIGSIMFLFAAFASLFGLFEEFVPYVLVLLPILNRLKYDVIVAAAVVLVGAGIGFACATLNPFTVAIAQDIARLSLYSGLLVRFGLLILFSLVGIWYVNRYARQVASDPSRSIMADIRANYTTVAEESQNVLQFEPRHRRALQTVASGIILMLLVTIADLIWRLVGKSPIPATEIRLALFLYIGFGAGMAAGVRFGQMMKDFWHGIVTFSPALILIALSQAIRVLAEDGRIIDTVLFYFSESLQGVSPTVSLIGMYGFQTVMNFFVPSGSAQALLTMPILAPLGTLVDVPAQLVVLAFQFGDGFSNIFFPTNGLLIVTLGLVNISWLRWARFILPLQIILMALAAVMLALLLGLGWS
ncbi:MAG: YfcC family protein [Leptospiraceae bacterium]|nr:YfcC family protein [Leptospiraceae bacterium]